MSFEKLETKFRMDDLLWVEVVYNHVDSRVTIRNTKTNQETMITESNTGTVEGSEQLIQVIDTLNHILDSFMGGRR